MRGRNIYPVEARIQIDRLKWLSIQRSDILGEEGEVVKIDVTDDLYATLDYKVRVGQLVNASIQGEVTGGKSTAAQALMMRVAKELIRMKKQPEDFDYYAHLVADQTEFLRLPKENNSVIVIDEWNRMAETGVNATTEGAWFDYFSDVFAQRYIHRISTSPSHLTDKNATILLDVIGTDKQNMITRCRVRYHNIGEHRIVSLGHADIDVSKVLNTEWYRKYRVKKFKRMDLLDKHGVRDIRELEFGEIVCETYKELEEYYTGARVPPHVVMATVRSIVQRKRLIYSLIAYAEIRDRVKAILDLDYEVRKLESKVRQYQRKMEDEPDGNYGDLVERAQGSLKKILEIRRRTVDNEELLVRVYKEYKEIT